MAAQRFFADRLARARSSLIAASISANPFASGKPVTLEAFGLPGFGYHSSEEEYVDLDGVEPRLDLLMRMIMDTARGR